MASVAEMYPAPEPSYVWSACVSPGIASEGWREARMAGWVWLWRFGA